MSISMDRARPDDAVSATAPQGWEEPLCDGFSEAQAELIRRAASVASTAAHDGGQPGAADGAADGLAHAVACARILHSVRGDHEVIAAVLLRAAVGCGVDVASLSEQFSVPVITLVKGVGRMEAISDMRAHERASDGQRASADGLHRMLLAMAEDVRVVLIKLADCLYTLRGLKALPEAQRSVLARESLDIFAPLANRLGVWQLKWEIEDHALRWLEPDAYRQIAEQLASRRVEREMYVEEVKKTLANALTTAGVGAELSGRPKHIYSIWRKMQRKRVGFERIFDMHAVRVLVDSVQACYGALGVVHTLWPPIAGEFDDYIATPKENNYQSIHTAVIGPDGRALEVQIRTHEMHENSELGVAAHWRYKEGRAADPGLDAKILWLRQLLEWKDEVADAGEFVDRFRSELFDDRVYVFTPKGRIVDLPAGATPLDFAYAIHSEVGDRCRGAKVNGRIVPLTHKLGTGEQVEVITVKKGGPSRDWLNPHLGYLRTPRARARVARWFKLETADQNIAAGRAHVERELSRMGLGEVSFEKLARRLSFARPDDLFAGVGRGEVKTARIVAAAQADAPPPAVEEESVPVHQRRSDDTARGVRIEGVGDLLTQIARCCNPLPGDAIIGFITRGQGVSIHRRDCRNILRLPEASRARLCEVDWGGHPRSLYAVDIRIEAFDRQGLLRDITSILTDAGVNVIGVQTRTDRPTNVARMQLSVEVADMEQLSGVLTQLGQLPNVHDARRVTR